MNPGEILDGRYVIAERLGAGGMGEVYRATHTLLGASRVIKVVRAQISGSEDAHERFLREARAATKVQHPHVATLHDFAALPDGSHYMVWEHIEGENLAQRLRAVGTLPPRQAVRIALQALLGLEAIHRAGIVHRDISPENLMIAPDGRIKIIDLGVAKLEDATLPTQTRTGIFVGKLRYASPEQLGFLQEGETIDARADLYSLAMVIVELLTGRPPYEAKSPHEYFILHAREAQPATVALPAELPASGALQPILEKALARDRNQRFATAADFAAALERVEHILGGAADRETVAVAFDGDATMKVTKTVSIRQPAATTLRTDVAPAPRSNKAWIAVAAAAAAVVFVTIAAAAVITMWPRSGSAPAPAVAQQAIVQPPRTSDASITVTSTATATPIAPADPTATVAPAQPEPPPVSEKSAEPVARETRKETPRPREIVARRDSDEVRDEESSTASEPRQTESERPRESAAPAVQTYIDGGGDGATNSRLVEQLRREVHGVTIVQVHGGDMQQQLIRSLKDHMPHLSVGDSDVVIRFHGTFERLGLGRKRRAADATVEKNGRIIFRYNLPDEIFRVGMLPQDAFARILSDAFLP